jgi:hypothetical protein
MHIVAALRGVDRLQSHHVADDVILVRNAVAAVITGKLFPAHVASCDEGSHLPGVQPDADEGKRRCVALGLSFWQ